MTTLNRNQHNAIDDMLNVLEQAVLLGNYPKSKMLKLFRAYSRYGNSEATPADMKLLTKIGNGGELE